jgi:hypothetical protein
MKAIIAISGRSLDRTDVESNALYTDLIGRYSALRLIVSSTDQEL